jgi:hypothetical protein
MIMPGVVVTEPRLTPLAMQWKRREAARPDCPPQRGEE